MKKQISKRSFRILPIKIEFKKKVWNLQKFGFRSDRYPLALRYSRALKQKNRLRTFRLKILHVFIKLGHHLNESIQKLNYKRKAVTDNQRKKRNKKKCKSRTRIKKLNKRIGKKLLESNRKSYSLIPLWYSLLNVHNFRSHALNNILHILSENLG